MVSSKTIIWVLNIILFTSLLIAFACSGIFGPYSELQRYKHQYVKALCSPGPKFSKKIFDESYIIYTGVHAYVYNNTNSQYILVNNNIRVRYPSSSYDYSNQLTGPQITQKFASKFGNESCLIPPSFNNTGILGIQFEILIVNTYRSAIAFYSISAIIILILISIYIYNKFHDCMAAKDRQLLFECQTSRNNIFIADIFQPSEHFIIVDF